MEKPDFRQYNCEIEIETYLPMNFTVNLREISNSALKTVWFAINNTSDIMRL